MRLEDHLSDRELILAEDGELPGDRLRHLDECPECGLRAEALEARMSEIRADRESILDPLLPPIEPAWTRLRASLRGPESSSHRAFAWRAALAGVAVASLIAAFLNQIGFRRTTRTVHHPVRVISAPLRSLTPGATRTVTTDEICSTNEGGNRVVPVSLAAKVFEEYGMRDAPRNAYEVDYLITPDLGGADDIRNLWPEPYESTVWNARVKDQLEQRLHAMVCSGQIDLSTAQRAIAGDWISAYKKYVHQ